MKKEGWREGGIKIHRESREDKKERELGSQKKK
jgi:hypothetical protein